MRINLSTAARQGDAEYENAVRGVEGDGTHCSHRLAPTPFSRSG